MRSVYFLLIGDPKYAQWAVNLAASIKFYSPSMRITVLCEPGYQNNIIDAEKVVFDEFIEIDRAICYDSNGALTPGIAKLNMYKYFKHEENLYIDVDSLVIKDISGLFDQNEHKNIGCDVVWQGDHTSTHWECHWATMDDVKNYYKLPEKYRIFEINSSYLYVKKCEESEAFFEQARKNIIPDYVGKWGKAFPDELAFNVAFAQTGIDPSGKIAITWNSQLNGTAKEPIHLVPHYYIMTYWGGKDNRHIRHYQNYDRLSNMIHVKVFGKHNPYKYMELMRRKYIQVHRSPIHAHQKTKLPTVHEPAKMAVYHGGQVDKITIIGRDNGAGLSKDRKILTDIIGSKYKVDFRPLDKYIPTQNSDVNIFTEVVNPRYFGKYNILIPNQEWFFTDWIQHLKGFHAIWVKTKLAYEIFSSMHPNVKYIGFTSVDMSKDVPKVKECFHAQGKSSDKGTEFLSNWPGDLPRLNIITGRYEKNNNVKHYPGRLNDGQFQDLANRCLIHVCPSTMEGFGHYINEAKAMSNVVITTNSAPMNELVTDKRFLCNIVGAKRKEGSLGTWTYTNNEEINRVIRSISDIDLIEVGKQNRNEFLKQDVEFKEQLMYELTKI